jgi:hypothetical protein
LAHAREKLLEFGIGIQLSVTRRFPHVVRDNADFPLLGRTGYSRAVA